MIKVEFLEDYKCCWKKGQVGNVLPSFAEIVIGAGIAKRLDAPGRHKMVEAPQKKKGLVRPYLLIKGRSSCKSPLMG